MSGYYDTVLVQEPVASAKMQLHIEDTDNDMWFRKLALAGTRRLHTLSLWKKCVKKLDVIDGIAELPCGFYRLIGARMGSGTNCLDAIYVDLNFITSCGCSGNVVAPFNAIFEIQDGKIIFHPATTGTNNAIDSVTIAYFGFDLDDNGEQKIYERYEEALMYFICWNFALQNHERFNQYIINEFKQGWLAQRRHIRSEDYYENFNYTKMQVAETVNAIVNDQAGWDVL